MSELHEADTAVWPICRRKFFTQFFLPPRSLHDLGVVGAVDSLGTMAAAILCALIWRLFSAGFNAGVDPIIFNAEHSTGADS